MVLLKWYERDFEPNLAEMCISFRQKRRLSDLAKKRQRIPLLMIFHKSTFSVTRVSHLLWLSCPHEGRDPH